MLWPFCFAFVMPVAVFPGIPNLCAVTALSPGAAGEGQSGVLSLGNGGWAWEKAKATAHNWSRPQLPMP